MVLHLHLFPSASLQFLNDLSWKLIFPCYWLLDHLVASFVSTTQEKRQCSQDPCASLTPCVLLSTPLYLLLIVLWLPFALLGFLVWAPLQTVRRPYLYSHRRVNAREPQREWKPQGRSYCFSSANVCLLPDALSRVNNLSDTQGRAREVGRRICNGATRPQIKIYIDSPTNSSVSANSFSSLGLQQGAGISQVSSTDYKPVEQQEGRGGPAQQNEECVPLTGQQTAPDCPIHSIGQNNIPDCPLHSTGQHDIPECPLHSIGQHDIPECPLHSIGQHNIPECPLHSTGQHDIPDCPLHSTGQHGIPECPIHSAGQHGIPVCPLHSTGQHGIPECPLHSTGQHKIPDCPIHSTGQHIPDCPLHSIGQHTIPDCPIHSTEEHNIPDCPLHAVGQHNIPECPLHSTEQHVPDCPVHSVGQRTHPDCPIHSTEQQGLPDCPLHVAGVQISIPTPEAVPKQAKAVAGGKGSPDSCVTSQESLTRVHSGNGGVSTNSLSHHTSALTNANGYKPGCFNGSFDHEISAFFPANLDFLCLQEVFDKQAEVKLRRELHSYFPFILSDVGRYAWKGCCSRFKCLNSGLLFASRYPILDADYYCYPNGQGEDALAAKGVLCAKVLLGKSPNDQRIVGYIACTHLHSIEGDSVVRFEQLDLLLECGIIFRKATKRQRDQIAFDVVMGDLNFDNCSSDDKLEQQHRIFRHYKDPCRLGPREDQPWALGTLLNISGLYNEEVSTPENMQKVMEHEEARKEYLVYPVGKKQCSKKKGQKTPLRGNGRRIDYILYSEEVQPPGWKVAVEEYSFITQLATLTDHLPVSMRLAVSTGVEVS